MSLFKISLGGREVLLVDVPYTGGSYVRHGSRSSPGALYEPDPAWLDLPSIAFIRNPFNRLVDCWLDLRFRKQLVTCDFDEFVCQVTSLGIRRPGIRRDTVEYYASIAAHPIHGLRFAKFIGRYESQQTDLDMFTSGLGVRGVRLPPRRVLQWCGPMLNTPSSLRRIYTYYKEDYEAYESMAGIAS